MTTPPPAWAAEVLRRATSVPPIDAFPGVDELLRDFHALAEEFPSLVRPSRVGTSQLGEPLECFTVGDAVHAAGGPPGPQHLVVGGVHPNEPVGAHTALHLARLLCEDDDLRHRLGATWHVVPCVDPDGARLNEGWFAGPFDRGTYARHFYRPAPREQVEWSFPFSYKGAYFDQTIPETFALMRLIDAVQPRLLVSLHNGEMGGVYYYLTRTLPGLVDVLHALPDALGLPLERGEAEDPLAQVWADAVYGMADVRAHYDHLEGLGLDPVAAVAGTSSADHAARYGTLSVVAELPYWAHPAAADVSGSGRRYADVLREKADGLRDSGARLVHLLAQALPMLDVETPFLRASRAFVPMLGHVAEHEAARASLPESDRPATVAEVFSAQDLVRCFRLRYGGMLVRALAAPVAAGTAPAALRRLHAEAAEVYETWQAEAAELEGTELLPIATLVGVQLGSALAAAFALEDEARTTTVAGHRDGPPAGGGQRTEA
ncbi:M14 family zinc carboxypeptidase [Pseudokineococcus basanitobsidens]|uniref:M14 family zinc carboxypeptidase n=1 Tax=Pseudokineococcus basanitobsidens TaxID=1926649 RepID=A0ABU8RNX1_9ACTN